MEGTSILLKKNTKHKKPNQPIKKLLIFLTFLTTSFFLFKPNPPLSTTQGATINSTLIIEKFPSNPCIKEISLSLDNKRINRVNQRRDPSLSTKNPDYFGKTKAFKPLFTLKVAGPLNVEIKGDGPTKLILLHVPKGLHEVDIYPNYDLQSLFSGKAGEKEQIEISQWKSRGPKLHVDTILTQWSGPNDLFLSTNNLMDIATLTKEFSEYQTGINIQANSVDNLLQKLGVVIKNEKIRYETDLPYEIGDDRGWQLVRSPLTIMNDKKANCIDIAVLTSIIALNNGFKPYIWANSGHALCAIGYKDEDAQQALPFEGTDYLKPPLKPPATPKDEPREYLPNEIVIYPKRNPPRGKEPKQDEVFSMDYTFWEKFYRRNPNL